MIAPEQLPEVNPLNRWLNKLRRYVLGITPRESHDIVPDVTASGTAFRFSSALGGGTAGSNIERLKLKSIHADYLLCKKLIPNSLDENDPWVEDGDSFAVIKPFGLRLNTDLPSGIADLTATGEQTRSFGQQFNTDGNTLVGQATQTITPRYVVDGFIWATKDFGKYTQKLGDVPIEWLDINVDGRHWEYDLKTIALCVKINGVDVRKYAQFRGVVQA